ncbi:hypothetical protein BH23ACT11_BH23ACT11_20160 [soil metagenome]
MRPPDGVRLRNGLERLESYTVHAERLGLELSSRDLKIDSSIAGANEAAALEIPGGERVTRVCRTLLVNGQSAAWMVDAVPEDVIPAEIIRDRFRPDAMLLDLLVTEDVPIGFSKLCVDAELVVPNDEFGDALELTTPSAALSLIETMYLVSGRPAQWSRNVFLPGNLDLHVVRELFETRHL